MLKAIFAAAFLLLPVVVGAAAAADNDASRYTLERSGDKFVRLDRQTGAMSLCTITNESLLCHMGDDERAGLQDDIDRLSNRVAALEKAGPAKALPSDVEVDRSIDIMERFMKSFMGMAREFKKEDGPRALPQNL